MTHITTKEFKRDGATKETTLKKRDMEVQKRKLVFNRYLKKSLGQQLEFSAKSIKGKKLSSGVELSAWEGVDTKAQRCMWKSEKSQPQSPWKYRSHKCYVKSRMHVEMPLCDLQQRISDLVVLDVRHRVSFQPISFGKSLKIESSFHSLRKEAAL